MCAKQLRGMHVSKTKTAHDRFLQSIMHRASFTAKAQTHTARFAHIIPESEESDMKACGQVF